MLLVYGTAGIALAVLVFGITLIGSRNPRQPIWAKEFLVADIYVPLMLVLVVLGVGCYLKFILNISSQAVGVRDIALAVGIAVASIFLLKLLRIKEYLAAFDSMEKSAEIIKPAVFSKEKEESIKLEPPVKPTSGKKAA